MLTLPPLTLVLSQFYINHVGSHEVLSRVPFLLSKLGELCTIGIIGKVSVLQVWSKLGDRLLSCARPSSTWAPAGRTLTSTRFVLPRDT